MIRAILYMMLMMFAAGAHGHILLNFALVDVKRSVQVGEESVSVTYDCALKPAALNPPDQLIDANGDKTASVEEKEAFFAQSRDYLAQDIFIIQQQVPLVAKVASFKPDAEKNAFHVVLSAPLNASPAGTVERLQIVDPVYMAVPTAGEQMGQTKVTATGEKISLIDEGEKRSRELSIATAVNTFVKFRREAGEAGVASATVLASAETTETSAPAEAAAKSNGDTAATRQLKKMVSQRDMSALTLGLFLMISAWLGALHALTPGHGKAIVGAYLVGSRGRIRDAVYLGLIVTFAHTSSVIALGVVALFASHIISERNLTIGLSLISGLLVFGFGAYLFITRLRADARGNGHHHPHFPGDDHGHDHGDGAHEHDDHVHEHRHAIVAGAEAHAHHEHEHVHTGIAGGDLVHEHGHVHLGKGHAPDEPVEHVHTHHDHGEAHHSHSAEEVHSHRHGAHSHAGGAHAHSHGGRMHTHVIPDRLTVRGLWALGISGGIVPCPDAVIVLLIAVALGRIGFGLLLIAAFSIGLAAVLVVIGIMMVTARPLVERLSGGGESRLIRLYLPVGSAAVVMLLGLAIVAKVLMDTGVLIVKI